MSQASAMEKRCILAVDDDRFLLVKLERGMRGVGYDTLQATSGEQALLAIAARTPDLASPDVFLCGMPGFALARRLRQCTAIPFMFLFARQDARQASQANFDPLTGLMAGRVSRESGASHGAYRVVEALKKSFEPSRERGSGGRLDRRQPIPARCGQRAGTGAEYRPGDVSCQVGGKGALSVL